MKKIIKFNLIILIIFCISFNFVFTVTNATSEESQESEEVEERQEEQEEQTGQEEEKEKKDLDELQLEKSELQEEIENSNNQIQFIEEQLTKNVVEIAQIEQNILDKQMEIQTLEAQEKDYNKYIEKAEKELEESNNRYDSRKDLLEKRIVAMYEMGQITYLDILFKSRNIVEFISNYYLLEEIASADEELLKEVKSELKFNKELKDSLETKKLIVTAYRETREKNAIALENLATIKKNKVQNLTEEEESLRLMIEEYQKEIADIETEIRLLAIANVGADYVGGVMAWPVPGYARITSQFGMRTHPITGVYKLHTGVDIGAPYGASFIAANDGIVTYAGENRAYGRMVIISHGGGITTLYAHGSEILVNVGDQVVKGTPVLKVGSTGYSTGPHAHFEVRINGEYVNPIDFITSYSGNNTTALTNTVNNNLVNNSNQVSNLVENVTVELNNTEENNEDETEEVSEENTEENE